MKLLIPGPVTTQAAVRAAAAQDYAPWDNDFRTLVADIRARVLGIARVDAGTHATLPLQGCGHFMMEAAVRTFVPAGSRILVPDTGSYARRAMRLAREVGVTAATLAVAENERADPAALQAALRGGPLHQPRRAGLQRDRHRHDPRRSGAGAGRRAAGRRVIVDAVSAFGALPLDLSALPMVDAAVFTSNKCLEACPAWPSPWRGWTGCSPARARPAVGRSTWRTSTSTRCAPGGAASASRRRPRCWPRSGRRWTCIDAEGGHPARLARYTANMRALYDGVRTSA